MKRVVGDERIMENYKLRKRAIVSEIFQLAEKLIQYLSEVEGEVEELLAEQEDAIVIPDSDFEPIQLYERKIKYRTFNGHSLVINEDGVVQYLQSENR